jgi:NADH-quinone oxidoreductase subunit F
MPAYEDEIRQAIDEGVIINCSWGVKRIVGNSNGVSGIDCIRCLSVFDDKGKFNPKYTEAEKKSFELDAVVVAIGQAPDLSFLSQGSTVQPTSAGTIKVNKSNLETDMDGVFAAGDAESGPRTVIEAITAGRKAAASIDKYLGGSGVIDEKLVEIEELSPRLGPGDGFADMSSVQMPCLPPKQRLGGFAEVELGLTEGMAIREANRCLRCQLRSQIPPIATPPVH